jgi:antitoxin component HigA of HigAB toxin-antitoxin module
MLNTITLERWNAFQDSVNHVLRPIENTEHYYEVAIFLDSLMDTVRGEYTRHALWPLVDYVTHLIGDYDAAHPLEGVEAKGMLLFYMEQTKISQVQLAKEIGLDQSLISKHLRGEREINLDHARAYSAFFKVPLEAFTYKNTYKSSKGD